MYATMATILALTIAFGLPKPPWSKDAPAELGQPETGTLSLGDADSLVVKAAELVGMKEDPILKKQIQYKIFRERPKYNEFFKRSAQLHGNTVAAEAFAALTTEHMKDTARSAQAKGAVSTSIKEVVNDKPQKDWTPEETGAILALEKKKGELSTDQLTSLAQSAASVALLGKYLAGVPKDGNDLIKSSNSLKEHFGKEGMITQGFLGAALTDSVKSINDAVNQAPLTAKEITRLGAALQAFAAS
jgi:hypothetical protein